MEMDASFIRQQYGITPEGFFTLDGCPAFRSGDQVYIRIRTEEAPDEIQERYAMANWLISFGERHVPEFLPAKDGYYIIAYRGEPCLVLRIPLRNLGEIRDLGRELAGFHRRGRTFAGGKALNRYGLWKEMWERRLEQLDAVWKTMEGKAPGADLNDCSRRPFPIFPVCAKTPCSISRRPFMMSVLGIAIFRRSVTTGSAVRPGGANPFGKTPSIGSSTIRRGILPNGPGTPFSVSREGIRK